MGHAKTKNSVKQTFEHDVTHHHAEQVQLQKGGAGSTWNRVRGDDWDQKINSENYMATIVRAL